MKIGSHFPYPYPRRGVERHVSAPGGEDSVSASNKSHNKNDAMPNIKKRSSNGSDYEQFQRFKKQPDITHKQFQAMKMYRSNSPSETSYAAENLLAGIDLRV